MGRGQNNKFFTGSGIFRQRDHYRIKALDHEFYKDLLVHAAPQRPALKDRLPRTELFRDLMVFTVGASLMKRW